MTCLKFKSAYSAWSSETELFDEVAAQKGEEETMYNLMNFHLWPFVLGINCVSGGCWVYCNQS